jgi:predicted nucleic acid-binding protein
MPERRWRFVISNTSPMVYLHRIGRLDLLPALYGRVVLPHSVCRELETGRKENFDVPDWTTLLWADTRGTRLPEVLCMVPDLGAGEAEVIALALECGPEALVVLDDGLGRRIANAHPIRMTGTVGVLCAGKRAGLLPTVRPALDSLLRVGFYLRPAVYREACRITGEE